MIDKPILSRETGNWLLCCWDECEKTGTTTHRTRFHDHAKGLQCDHPDARHPWYTFCTERHRQYFLHSHHSLGNLPAGYRLSLM
jgi:hypothetical protein